MAKRRRTPAQNSEANVRAQETAGNRSTDSSLPPEERATLIAALRHSLAQPGRTPRKINRIRERLQKLGADPDRAQVVV